MLDYRQQAEGLSTVWRQLGQGQNDPGQLIKATRKGGEEQESCMNLNNLTV